MAEVVFDVVIVGAGQAAEPLLAKLRAAKKNVALIERKFMGGSCVNFGCTPTKAAIACAKVAHMARRGADFGLRIPTVEVDFPAVLAVAKSVAEESRIGLEDEYADEGVVIFRGLGQFTGKEGDVYLLKVGDQVVRAKVVVLDTGTRTVIPPIEGLAHARCIHAGNWLDHKELPKRLVMLGGGVISLEMAQFYCRMGSEVTILESHYRIAATEEPEISAAIADFLTKEGITIRTNTNIMRVEDSGDCITLKCDSCEFKADALFVATGRTPNTDDLGLDTVGVELDARGYVKVDELLRTTQLNIYAAGDIRGGLGLTSNSWDDNRIISSTLLGENNGHTTHRIVPYGVFTDPELGRVGMTEAEARKAGKKVKVGTFDMVHNGLARERQEKTGLIKVIAEEGTDLILGASVLAAQGADMLQIFVDLMNAKAPFTVLRECVVAHPTFAEACQSATEAIPN